jgi:hypothetical protein
MAFSFRWNSFRPAVGAALLCSLTVCGGPSHDIVGKWRTSDDPNTVIWEFASNRAVTIGNVKGRYSFGDNNRVKIETPFGTSVYQVTTSREHMTFRESTGSKIEFTRVK